jgi:hypothetical protein
MDDSFTVGEACHLEQNDNNAEGYIANFYDEILYFMRKRIIGLFQNVEWIEQSKRDSMEKFIDSAPDSIVRDLYARLIADTEAAETIMWKKKLQDYINGTPPPPKYETDRGVRRPLQFLEEVWGEYMDHGVLYQDVLSSYDDKIIPAIYSHWNRYPRSEKDRLPLPKQDRTDTILQRMATNGHDTIQDILHAARAYEKRSQRSR